MVEIALTIIVIIIVFTEFLKYINNTSFLNKPQCECNKESFAEDELFKRDIDDRYQLRYWGKMCP